MNDDPMRAGADPAEPVSAARPLELSEADIRHRLEEAARSLSDAMARSERFLELCENQAEGPSHMALPALASAARLIRAQTDAAAMLARVARGETRHRSIVEFANLPPRREPGDLNSKFSRPTDHMTDDEIREEIERRLFPPGFDDEVESQPDAAKPAP